MLCPLLYLLNLGFLEWSIISARAGVGVSTNTDYMIPGFGDTETKVVIDHSPVVKPQEFVASQMQAAEWQPNDFFFFPSLTFPFLCLDSEFT